MSRARVRVGDVVRIPLPDGRYAFGTILRDAAIGVHATVSRDPNDLPKAIPYLFVVGVYEDVLKSGLWPVIGRVEFAHPDDEWPPAFRVTDPISGQRRIYFKGVMAPSTIEATENLEPAAVWDRHHIVSRILAAVPGGKEA